MKGHKRSPGYQSGNHWNTCQKCSKDIRSSESLEEWTGLIVCEDCFDERHPQDFIEAVEDDTEPDGLTTSTPADNMLAAGIDIGDADKTLFPGVDSQLQRFDTTLTANRTVTLSTVKAVNNISWFRIERTDTEAFTVDIGGLVTMPVSSTYFAVVQYVGDAWTLLDSGVL